MCNLYGLKYLFDLGLPLLYICSYVHWSLKSKYPKSRPVDTGQTGQDKRDSTSEEADDLQEEHELEHELLAVPDNQVTVNSQASTYYSCDSGFGSKPQDTNGGPDV